VHTACKQPELHTACAHKFLFKQELKKDALKVAGAGWLACAAHNAYNGYQVSLSDSAFCWWLRLRLPDNEQMPCQQVCPSLNAPHQSCLSHTQSGTQPRDVATANAIGQAVLGGLCLYKGFERVI
jgi:hypothetical protein